MILKKWDDLPEEFKTETIEEYYRILSNKKVSLLFKRVFDIVVSMILLIISRNYFTYFP